MDPDHRLLLRNTKPLLQSRSAAVVMAVAQLYFHLAPKAEVGVIAKALVRLLRSHRCAPRPAPPTQWADSPGLAPPTPWADQSGPAPPTPWAGLPSPTRTVGRSAPAAPRPHGEGWVG